MLPFFWNLFRRTRLKIFARIYHKVCLYYIKIFLFFLKKVLTRIRNRCIIKLQNKLCDDRGDGMREILFRGKRIDTGKWVYGAYLAHDYGGHTIFNQNLGDGSLQGFEVIPETIGQYTGLDDKNSVKIFEGDIVSNGQLVIYSTGQKRQFDNIGVIRYDTENGCLVINNDDGRTKRLTVKVIKNDHVQVIGNIHE